MLHTPPDPFQRSPHSVLLRRATHYYDGLKVAPRYICNNRAAPLPSGRLSPSTVHPPPHHLVVRSSFSSNTAGPTNTSAARPSPRFWPSAPGDRHLAPDGHQHPKPHKCLAGSPPRHWCISPWASRHGYASSDAVIPAPRAVFHAASDGANHFNQKDDGDVGRALSPTAVAAGSSPSPPTPLWPPTSRRGPAGSHDR